ncbi:MAG: PqqD family peptide modification chaperone [Nitrospirae bacterium]|nr:MAG: PqqD family peptide modification chaperone [Nitrospirota bacterium]
MRVFKQDDVMWREETEQMKKALSELSAGRDAGDITTGILFRSGRMFALNIVATEIWKICDGKTPGEIAEELAERFDADPEDIEHDVISLIEELKEAGFVRYE